MARTLRRQPFSVSTDSNDYSKQYLFTQAEFKGLYNGENDIAVEAQSFADVKNVYVDENGLLVSRPPFKFYDGEGYIVDQWVFGVYTLRLHRILMHITEIDGETVSEQVSNPQDYPMDELYFVFVMRCITHSTVSGTINGSTVYADYGLQIPVSTIGWDNALKVTCVPIEDKIFVWFAGVSFIALNMSGVLLSDGNTYLYFEDAIKYLYFPIHKLVINGIESDNETKNFLTETYRRRYHYSTISSVNFETLIGRQMSVRLESEMTQNKSKYLYDIIVGEHQDKMMVYPYSPIGHNYHIDIVQTNRATVILRYSIVTHIIEISFDGKYYRPIPIVEDVIGLPLLTRDGLWVVAFTKKGIAKCRIVAQEIEDFYEPERVLTWTIDPYMRKAVLNGYPVFFENIDTSFIPTGYFETIDQFAYIFKAPSVYNDITMEANLQYVYSEWLSGTSGTMWAWEPLIIDTEGLLKNLLVDDNIKMHFRYIAPTAEQPDLGAIITIMGAEFNGFSGPTLISLYFKRFVENVRGLQNDDLLSVMEKYVNSTIENVAENTFYIHRISSDGKQLIDDAADVVSNDLLLLSPLPVTLSEIPEYNSGTEYHRGDFVAYTAFEYVYKCINDVKGVSPDPSNIEGMLYWQAVKNPFDRDLQARRRAVVPVTLNDGQAGYMLMTWKAAFMTRISGARYYIKTLDSVASVIDRNARIELTPFQLDVTYTAAEMQNYFGPLEVYDNHDTPQTEYAWGDTTIRKDDTQTDYSGYTVIVGLDDTAGIENKFLLLLGISDINASKFSASGNQMDVRVSVPVMDKDGVSYETKIAYGLIADDKSKRFDVIANVKYDVSTQKIEPTSTFVTDYGSKWFRIMPDTDNVLTDLCLYVNKEIVSLPRNGELTVNIDDKERIVANDDNLVLALQTTTEDGTITYAYDGNIHKLSDDGTELTSGLIESGSLVAYVKDASTEQDYLEPIVVDRVHRSRCFCIEALGIVRKEDSIEFAQVKGNLKIGELIRLRAYDKEIILPRGNPGNPYNYDLTLYPWEYPAAPANWEEGDDWPATFPTYPPIYPNPDGTLRFWQPGDALPTGPIEMYGIVNLQKRIQPLSINSDGVWYNIDGTLWTSQLDDTTLLTFDEYVNSETQLVADKDSTLRRVRYIDFRSDIPEHHAVLNEHYFSFTTRSEGHNLLEVTATRYDEDKLFSDEGTDFLLYLPKRNEQKFSNKITNLHSLSDAEMGVFTANEVWYISSLALDDGTLVYTKPVKSKIPLGCRDGDDVITALDGQAIIFPTARGVTALTPQDFVATTEKTLTYLSDAIQEKYNDFYNETVMSSVLVPSEFEIGYKPMIKIRTYKYWILFYKYMDREILALDTRTGSWWIWTTPYPIRSISVGSRLHVLMQIDFSPIEKIGIVFPTKKASLMGVSFVWTDKEISIVTDEDSTFPAPGDTPVANIGYYDDTVSGALNGLSEWISENKFVGGRRILQYASPIIDWHIISQKLHFNQIDNYKTVKGFVINLKGTDTFTAKLSTKAFRDYYHPEQNELIDVKVNDLRTFIKRLNIMHIVDFQYKLENDINARNQHQLKLNALSVKYEVKERLR